MKTLEETAPMMSSANYKERFLAEYYQLETRINKLEKMVKDWDEGKLTFTPTCPRLTYSLQLRSMMEYFAILQMRAKMEYIEV